jgi:hypothetical protein
VSRRRSESQGTTATTPFEEIILFAHAADRPYREVTHPAGTVFPILGEWSHQSIQLSLCHGQPTRPLIQQAYEAATCQSLHQNYCIPTLSDRWPLAKVTINIDSPSQWALKMERLFFADEMFG